MDILLSGATGRIGREIRALVDADAGLALSGAASGGAFFDEAAHGDVLIDFSRPEATARCIEFALARDVPLVIGTTGLDDALQSRIDAASATLPICQAANFSIGVNLLLVLAARAAEALPASFDVEILELHHRWKADAPSGTALALGRAVAAARGAEHEAVAGVRRDRREAGGEIGYQVARGGDVAGEHSVLFLGDGERLELTHRATDRGVFARGALHVAGWLQARKPGLYSMRDVLG